MALGTLAVFHGAALAGISAMAVSHYRAGLAHRLSAAFLLIWFSLSVAGYALGAVGLLGDLPAYIVLSTAVALGSWCFLRRFGDTTARGATVSPAAAMARTNVLDGAVVFAGATLAAVAVVGVLILTISYYPNNYDTLAYRFTRVMLYLGQGSFRHLWILKAGVLSHVDARLSFYPLTGVLLYLPDALYGFDGRMFTLTGVMCWLVGAAAVFALSREMGASRAAALLTAALFLVTPAALVSATSTNDDLISGVPLIAAVLFGVRWARSRSPVDAVLTGIAIGVSCGTKLHFLFYIPAVAALGLYALWNGARRATVLTALRHHIGQVALAAGLAAVLAVPALGINLWEYGTLLPYAPENMNRPFSVVSALVNAVLYTTQLFLAPIPALFISRDPAARQHVYALFNDFFSTHVFPWVSPALHYQAQAPGGPIIYQFRGIADPTGWLGIWEESVWVGFTPWLLALAMVVAFRLRRRQPGAPVAFWLCAALFLWHLGRCIFSKYIEGAGVYYAFSVGAALPAAAWLWQVRRQAGPAMARLILVVLALTIAGDGVLAYNTFMFNRQRNIPEAVAAGFAPRRNSMSDDVRACLAASDRVAIAYTHWELSAFQIMEANMTASYRLVEQHPADDSRSLLLYSYPGRSEYGHIPVRVAGSERGELTNLGFLHTIFGKEVVLVRGPAPACASPERAGYVVLQSAFIRDGGPENRIKALTVTDVVGAAEGASLQVRLEQVLPDGTERLVSDWVEVSRLKDPIPLAVPATDGSIRVQAREAGSTEATAATLFPLKQGQELELPPPDPTVARNAAH